MFIKDIGDVEIRTSKRAKHIRLAVSARTGVYVVKPRLVSERLVRRFVSDNKAWVNKHLSKIPKKLILRQNEKFSRTKTLKIEINSNVSDISSEETDNELVMTLPLGSNFSDDSIQEKLMKKVVAIWRSEARIYLPKRLETLAKIHGMKFNDVRVKYMHSRWGSCSSRNNINLNIQLMRLAPDLIDHVLLHELAHTVQHNHSKAFWDLFESIEPGARKISKTLKSHQLF